jgi:hypothetical protein
LGDGPVKSTSDTGIVNLLHVDVLRFQHRPRP